MVDSVIYPQIYRNDDGVELGAINEIQASAFVNGGFKLVEESTKKQGRKSKTDE